MLLLYSNRLCITIATFRPFVFSTYVLFIFGMQSVNGAQFLNVTWLFHLSVYLEAASAPDQGILIPLFLIIYT